MKPFSFMVLALCCSLTCGQNYSIIRRVRHADDFDQPDLVKIPSSLCHDNGTTECPSMDGGRYSVCQCSCNKKDDANRYFYKSTFGFYNGTWKCEKNSVLRRRSGCQFSVDLNGLNDPILTVPVTSTYSYPLSNVTTTHYISIPPEVKCFVKADNSMYLTCSGEWKQLNSTLVTKRFQVYYHDREDVRIQVVHKANSSYHLPSGRIIKLAVTCTDRPWESSQCILLKIQGQLQCPVYASPYQVQPPAQASSKDSTSIGLLIGFIVSGVAVLATLIVLVIFKRRIISGREFNTTESGFENRTYWERFGGAQNPTQMEEYTDQEGQRRATSGLAM